MSDEPVIDRRAQLLGDALHVEACEVYRRQANRDRCLLDFDNRVRWRRRAARLIRRLEIADVQVDIG